MHASFIHTVVNEYNRIGHIILYTRTAAGLPPGMPFLYVVSACLYYISLSLGSLGKLLGMLVALRAHRLVFSIWI